MGSKVMLCLFVGVAGLLLCNLQTLSGQGDAPFLHDFMPKNGPISGGTLIHVIGNGFIMTGSTRSKCKFEDSSYGSHISADNLVHNSTYLTCTLPEIVYLPSSVLENGHRLSLSVTAGDFAGSNEVYFFVYDLSAIRINDISPNEGLNLSRTLISISGGGFFDTGEITCSLESDEQTLVPATYINSSCLECLLPTFQTSARIHVDISLNGHPSANVQPASSGSTTFTFFVSPPQLVSCEFSSSYVLLFLGFDREVEIGGESDYNTTQAPNCNLIFSNDTLGIIGPDAMCFWYNSQQRSVVVRLMSTSTIRINTTMSLRGDSIRTRAVEFSRLANNSITVSPSTDSEILTPIPVLELPGSIPYCGNFTATAENSQHGGPRPLEYKWSIAREMGMPIDTVQMYLPDDFTNQSTIIIPSIEFMDNTLYTIQLIVRNFLGVESTAIANVSKVNAPSPEVLILGSRVKRVVVNAEVRLEAMVVLPGCLNVSGLVDYSWQIGTQMDLDLDIGSVNRQSTVVVIPPYVLLPDSEYTAVITASVGRQSANASVQLVTEVLHIRARINSGIRRAVGVNDTIILDGSISEGLNGNMTSDPQLLITWKCANITGLLESIDCNETAVSIQSTLTNEIPAGTLSTGVYNFSLTLKYLDLESSTYQVVHILPHHFIPRVAITPPLRLESVPVHRRLLYHATIHSELPGTAKWSSEYVIGYAQLDLHPNVARTPIDYDILPTADVIPTEATTVLYTSNITATPLVNQISLALVSNILLPNSPYRFRLEVTNIQGHTGYAEIDIRTESLPIAGRFDIQPATGDSLATMFSLRALGWTDDIGDTPLSFQFGFKLDGDNVYWLTGILTQNQLSTILPIVASGNRSLVLVLHIYDQNGAYTHYEYSVNLAYSGTSIDLLSLMQMIEEMSLEQGNWIEGLANLMSVAVSANRNPDIIFTQINTFKHRAVTLINQLHDLSIPASKSFLNQLLSLLSESTMEAQLSEDILVGVSRLLESVIETYNAIGETTEPGFSQEEAQMVFATYGNMISSNSQFGGTRIESDPVTDSLLNIIPRLGYGMCLQKGIAEDASFIFVENIGSLKTSWINLPQDYKVVSYCEECLFSSNEVVVVNFGSELFLRYLQQPCSGGRTNGCSGVCVISAQFKRDLRWQGSPYLSYVKSPFVQLSLIDPQDGSVLEVQELGSDPIELGFPILTEVSDPDLLECVFWNGNEWSNIGCTTQLDSSTHVTCQCDHLSEIVVLERCESGYYGDNCADVCPQGLWGQECLMSCDCSSRGTCSAHDGSCDCEPGWTGNRCQTVCPDGSWGITCEEICLCENGGECNPVDGSCDCQPGWIGQYCNTPCSSGFYGDGCIHMCECRTASECVDKVTGACTCLPGYTGVTCHDPCPEYSYGLQCALECSCNLEGTRSCDHVNGICNCLEQWRGTFCDFEITPPPSQSPVTSPMPQQMSADASFQIWWAVIPILLAIIAAVVIIITLLFCYKLKKRKKVLPISQAEKQDRKKVEDVVAVAEEQEVTITKAKSYEVLVPSGSDLKDMFPKQKDSTEDFQEPPELNGKLRWQIVQVLTTKEEKEEARKVSFSISDSKPELSGSVGSDMEHEASDKLPSHQISHSDEEQMTEVVYKRGIYLSTNATLKDLRNAFIDSKQIEPEERMFQFLNSDVLGDSITIDTEDEVLLEQIEHRLVQHRTVYIETLAPENAQHELCVCGKFADMECTECQKRGYCSEGCQQEDWHRHVLTCQVISAKRRKKRKKKKRKQKRTSSRGYTPTWEICICGKPAEFECSNCSQQGYCSEECQNEDWSFHEYYCQLGPHRNSSAAPSKGEKLEPVEEVSEVEDASDHPEDTAADMKEKPLSERSEVHSTPEESSPVPQLEVPETLPVPRKIKVAWMDEQKWKSPDEMSKNEDEKGRESRYSHTPDSSSQSNSSHLY